MTEPVADYSAFVVPAGQPGGELSQLQELAEKQAKAESEVARIEAELNKAKETLKSLCEVQVPALMDQIGITEFKTASGLVIKVDETIRASIPKARTLEAFAWLRAHNHAALIKRELSVAFGKGEDAKADELAASLRLQGVELDDNATVHAQTLGAFVREQLRDGIDLPLDLFGVFRQRVSKIEMPTAPKAKRGK